jgi:hypothetical protein
MTSFAQEIKWKEDNGMEMENSPPEQQKLMQKK